LLPNKDAGPLMLVTLPNRSLSMIDVCDDPFTVRGLDDRGDILQRVAVEEEMGGLREGWSHFRCDPTAASFTSCGCGWLNVPMETPTKSRHPNLPPKTKQGKSCDANADNFCERASIFCTNLGHGFAILHSCDRAKRTESLRLCSGISAIMSAIDQSEITLWML
jgi:hypothetical protein